jgi:hypothetical protein
MTLVLQAVTRGIHEADIRELIIQCESMTPAHVSGLFRPTVAEIMENYEIDESLTEPPPNAIGLFDDILTAGSHFRAAKLVLLERFPGVPIVGVFLAAAHLSARSARSGLSRAEKRRFAPVIVTWVEPSSAITSPPFALKSFSAYPKPFEEGRSPRASGNSTTQSQKQLQL